MVAIIVLTSFKRASWGGGVMSPLVPHRSPIALPRKNPTRTPRSLDVPPTPRQVTSDETETGKFTFVIMKQQASWWVA